MKIELGSGPRNRWYWEDAIHYDCEPYDGVIQWTCPEPVPLPNQSVDEVYIGGLLIELDSSQHLALAKELNRIMKQDGTILMRVYEGSIGFSEFFYELRKFGWYIVNEELNNMYQEEDGTVVVDYMIKIKHISEILQK